MFNIAKVMQQAQKMQKQMENVQEELKNTEVLGSSGGSLVEVKANAQGAFLGIKIKPEAIKPDNPESVDRETIETLEDLISSAIIDASEKAAKISKEKLSPISNQINAITGGFGGGIGKFL